MARRKKKPSSVMGEECRAVLLEFFEEQGDLDAIYDWLERLLDPRRTRESLVRAVLEIKEVYWDATLPTEEESARYDVEHAHMKDEAGEACRLCGLVATLWHLEPYCAIHRLQPDDPRAFTDDVESARMLEQELAEEENDEEIPFVLD